MTTKKEKRAFTLSESAAHANTSCHPEAKPKDLTKHNTEAKKRCFAALNMTAAFTLAETLITLLVIGVVAALTIPALLQNLNERALLKQRQTVAAKIAEGFANMRVAGDLETKYASTAEFVEAMKKHFQISAVCESNNLSACFAETVTSTKDGEDAVNTVSEMKDVDKVIGLRLSDGTSMLIKYNPEAEGIPEGNSQVGRATIKGDTVTPATFEGLFEYVFDVNGNKSPNAKGKDMLGDLVIERGMNDPYGLGFEIINNTKYSSDTYGYAQGPAFSEDYWLGAKNYCESLGGSLPDKSQLDAIAAKLYPCTPNDDYYGCSPDTTNELWSVVGNVDLWSSVPSSDVSAYYRVFNESYSRYYYYSRNNFNFSAICVR